MPASNRLEPQAALETAAVQLIRQLGYDSASCDRTAFGEPFPSSPQVFVAVWSDLSKLSTGRVSVNERYSFKVTISRKSVNAKDRWIVHRDDLEKRGNQIRSLLALDGLDYRLINLANQLGDYNPAGGPDETYQAPVGFNEAAEFKNFEGLVIRGPAWFSGKADSQQVGMSLTLNFGNIGRIQYQQDALAQGRA